MYEDTAETATEILDNILAGNSDYTGMVLYSLTPPVTPTVTDDFGGEYTYLRGAAASPLSVSATVTDGGTLSYQWYYIDSENVDVAVSIDGATGTTFIPDTRSVGSRYYFCVVTNTLGDLTADAVSDYAYITVTRPALGDGYQIYDYKDYIAGSSVDGSDKTYILTFPKSGIYTELYGGFSGALSLLDYYIGTEFYCDLPSSALANEDYSARLDFYLLGMGSQYNVLKLRNIGQGIPASIVFSLDLASDYYCSTPVLTLYWYDSDMELIGSTEYDLINEVDADSGSVIYSAAWDFIYPGAAAYCAYSVSLPDFQPEENADFSAEILISDLVLTFSMMEDISGSIGDVSEKVDQVGGKIDETNDKLDDILSGGEAGEELIQGSDKLEEGGVQLGGAVDDLHNTQDSLPAVPDDLSDVLVDNTALVAGSNVNGFMPWNDPDYGEFWNLLFTPTIAAVSVALLLYFVFGKARSAA